MKLLEVIVDSLFGDERRALLTVLLLLFGLPVSAILWRVVFL